MCYRLILGDIESSQMLCSKPKSIHIWPRFRAQHNAASTWKVLWVWKSEVSFINLQVHALYHYNFKTGQLKDLHWGYSSELITEEFTWRRLSDSGAARVRHCHTLQSVFKLITSHCCLETCQSWKLQQQHVVAIKVAMCKFIFTAAAASFTTFPRSPAGMDSIEASRICLLMIHALLQFRFNFIIIFGLAQL